MEYGLHIADFTWASGQRDLGPALARHVRNAEASGIQRITVMDHFWQLPGIGAAWNEQESRGLGFAFPPVAERFRKLEETIQICLQMWADEEEPYEGAIWQLERALNSPQSITRPHPYLMIGGGGERKTLRLVAQYADACNLGASPEAAHKLDVLRAHCDDVERDYDDLEKTAMIGVNPESTSSSVASVVSGLADLGFTATYVYSVGIDEPSRVVELIAGAAEKTG